VTPPLQHEVHAPSESQQNNSDLIIMVVDDNIDSAKSMEMLLQLIGHQTLIAYDGQTAVELAIQQRPTAILLDIGLPGLDGYQVCRQLRAQGLSETYIVAMTGYGLEADRQRTKEAGFNEHLVKPLNLTVLQELLSNLQSFA